MRTLKMSSEKTSYSQREGQSCTGSGSAASQAIAQHFGRDGVERHILESLRGGSCDHGSTITVGGARVMARAAFIGRDFLRRFLPRLGRAFGPGSFITDHGSVSRLMMVTMARLPRLGTG